MTDMSGEHLKDIVSLKSGFQYSVNLKYDFRDDSITDDFLVTPEGLSIAKTYLKSVLHSANNRAHLLLGPYGKGKSKLILFIMSMLCSHSQRFPEIVAEEIIKTDPEVIDLFNEYKRKNGRLLPVIVNGNSEDLIQELMIALREALVFQKIENLVPDNYYTSAIKTIEAWQQDFPMTYLALADQMNGKVDEFIQALQNYDRNAYNDFLGIYPNLTSGSLFQPLLSFSLADAYHSVAAAIKPYGFTGIFVVYDEFSKYLESAIDRNTSVEIKQLQDFAERCNRSGEEQVHLTLISHKSILSYVDRLPKEKVNAWKAVGNRFQQIEIQTSSNHMYSLITQAFRVDQKFLMKRTISTQIEASIDNVSRLNLFDHAGNDLDKLVESAFPLHPATLYMLPRVSELVAQNERTLFTFLLADEKKGFVEFIKSAPAEFILMTPDKIYDYFESLFRLEQPGSNIYAIYKKVRDTLESIEPNEGSGLSRKIIKTIGLIYIINNFSKLAPTVFSVSWALSSSIYSIESIREEINRLIQSSVIHHKSTNDWLILKAISGKAAEVEIQDEIARREISFRVKSTLLDCIEKRYIFPTRYNDEYSITRFFKVEFILTDELEKIRNYSEYLKNSKSDGLYFAVISDDNEVLNDFSKVVKNIDCEQIITVFPTVKYHLHSVLQRYDAISSLISNSHEKRNDSIMEDLEMYLDDARSQITKVIDGYFLPELRQCNFYHAGKKVTFNRVSDVNRFISEICKQTYPQMPIVINEMINKTHISSQIAQARLRILDGLLKAETLERLGIVGYGPDYSIMQSTLVKPGILIQAEGSTIVNTNNLSPQYQYLLDYIQKWFLSSRNCKLCFKDLYDLLQTPTGRIGIRPGIIPIYIAVVLHGMKKDVTLYWQNNEIEISAKTLDQINKSPEDYFVKVENWTQENVVYLNQMESLFASNINTFDRELNQFERVVKGMQRWFISLTKYAKEYQLIDASNNNIAIFFKGQLKHPNINSRELLLDILPKYFRIRDNQYSLIVEKISDVIQEIEMSQSNLYMLVQQTIHDIFLGNSLVVGNKLIPDLKDWRSNLSDYAIHKLYNNGEDKFLKIIEQANGDSHSFIQKVAMLLVGLRPEDWAQTTHKLFTEKLASFHNTITFSEANPIYSKICKIQFDESSEPKLIENIELSAKAKMAYTDIYNILNEEYGPAISVNEKRQIVVSVLKKLCE